MSLAFIHRPLGTHSDINGISRTRDKFWQYFRDLDNLGVLNNTLVMFGSDHGVRVGPYFRSFVGAYEARLPFTYLIFPKWFQEKYKSSMDNLRLNGAKRLTTNFDIYKTLKGILNRDYSPPSLGTIDENSPGINLLSAIPETRGCKEAGAPEHWCACGSYITIPHDDPRAVKAGEVMIKGLNAIIKMAQNKCVEYKEFTIIESKVKLPSQDISLTIRTTPVIANFRSTIRPNAKELIISNIERLDTYFHVVKCLEETKQHELLPMTCVCKDAAYRTNLDKVLPSR